MKGRVRTLTKDSRKDFTVDSPDAFSGEGACALVSAGAWAL